MARKKKGGHGGGHGWFVTFADLMGLLMSFFVVIAAFSTMDKIKMAQLAGSMRDAFGQTHDTRLAGVVELSGVPTREFMRELSSTEGRQDTAIAAERHDQHRAQGRHLTTTDQEAADAARARAFASAAASLRQSWQALPDVAAISQNVMMEETPEGLDIRLVDQDGRAMFQENSRYPYDRTRAALEALGPVLARMPNPIRITGHTSSRRLSGRPGYSNWDLSAERANVVRQILMEHGLPSSRVQSVVGKADSEPSVPGQPAAAANARVVITLMYQAPPLPGAHRP